MQKKNHIPKKRKRSVYYTPAIILALLIYMIFIANCQHDSGTTPVQAKFELIVYDPVPVSKSNCIRIYAHYMPWYESKEINGQWGIHWTMANRNPDIVDNNGNRQIASYYYPLIGPYSSMDEDVIEYHLLLMKLSGIDGVLIDWYGSYNVFDYQQNRINSEALIDKLDDAGLDFGIVYEDYTTENVFRQGQANSPIEAARNDMQYLDDYYFTNDQYIEVDNSPLLLVFGPRYFERENEWTQIFTDINKKPHLLTLWYESSDAGANADGEFGWVYRDHLSDLGNFYANRVPNIGTAIGSAYPGFKDFYDEGGWGSGLGWEITHNSTQTFSATLDMTKKTNIPILQLVTWNDFGEGTMIEPTQEFGFSLLELVQQFVGVDYTDAELKDVHVLYEYRKKYKNDANIQLKLDQVYNYLVSLQINEATQLLDEIE